MIKTPRYKKFIKEITKEYYEVHRYKELDPKEKASKKETVKEPEKEIVEQHDSPHICYSLEVDDSGLDWKTPDVKAITDEFELFKIANKSFHECLFFILDQSDLDEVDFYKAAGFDRRLFSTIRSNKNYQPSRDTAIACCIAFGLSQNETDFLLMSAGYSLAINRRDAAIRFCIKKGIRKVAVVNDVLDAIGEKLIGR